MVVFETLKFKNFLSTGDAWTEVNFTANKTTLVVGPNGSGKSTILDALSFCLFGKAHRNIKKAQLVNSINKKGALCEVTFRVHGCHFNIRRGIKPNIFEIWKDGVMINQNSHAKEYQKILEQNIIKLNHKSFHQIVVLGSSSFVPFMQLSSNNRNEVIQELLDIGVFSSMYLLLREKNSVLKDQIKQNTHDISILEAKIWGAIDSIDKIKLIGQEQRDNKEQLIFDWECQINELECVNKDLLAKVDACKDVTTESQSRLQQQLDGYAKFKLQFSAEMKQLGIATKFYKDNDECPTCSQEIDPKLKRQKIATASGRVQELEQGLQELDGVANTTMADMLAIQDTMNDIQNDLQTVQQNSSTVVNLNSNISNALQEIQNIGKGAGDLTEANAKKHALNEQLEAANSDKSQLSEQAVYNRVIAELLKDTGIRTKIIKQYLPVINKVVNQYLQILDFFVSFNLDENFQETIRSRHRDDFTYDSFSEGEKQRIDLALLFTWRMIAKMKNSVSTNLLLLDETFDSSLDVDGVDNLMKILDTFDSDTNVFVISHKTEELEGKFESKIEFKRTKNFSKMTISKGEA